MSRFVAITCRDFMTPGSAINGLHCMSEGYDGSGIGLLLRDLGGPFDSMKDAPILSGIFQHSGLRRLDRFMLELGFTTKYKVTFKLAHRSPAGVPKRDVYLVRAYDYPSEWETLSREKILDKLMLVQLEIKQMGAGSGDMMVFSFWPDTILIKEIGDPATVADYLDLDRRELCARLIMALGRQNTNYEIDLYACHPFFLQGFATMTNGENTAFACNRNFLSSRGFPGYNGYRSDSEVFTHTLHYTLSKLNLGLEAFKHILTPLNEKRIKAHPDGLLLSHLKQSCRQLILDGPNCIVGSLPDHTLFMAQDSKKLRPGIIGGGAGKFAFASEVCGLDALIPERDASRDLQPMHLDTACIGPERRTITLFRQTDPLNGNGGNGAARPNLPAPPAQPFASLR